MSDKKEYVSPPQDPLTKRLIKKVRILNDYIVAVFKAPYKKLSTGEKILKTVFWLALIAMIVVVVLGIFTVVFALIAGFLAMYVVLMAFSGDGRETVAIKNNYGRTIGSITRKKM